MNRKQNNLLTSNEVIYILIGAYVGVGIFSLPNQVVKVAGQDGWISALLGAAYPIYVIFLAGIAIKRHPDENILVLSKKYFGSIIGSIMNMLFALMFILILTAVVSGTTNILRTYVVPFISPIKFMGMALAVAGYAAFKGLKPLGRVTKYLFYLITALLLTSVSALEYGRISNLQPVFGTGIKNILLGVKETIFQYITVEIIFLIYPYTKDKEKVVASALKATGIVTLFYGWAVFITIYYLGIDIIPKNYWSYVMVSESVQIAVVNNFRFIFLFLWTLISLKVMSVEYYAASFVLSDLFKAKRETICFIIYPIIVFFSVQYKNEVIRRQFLGVALDKAILFNLIYVTLVVILMLIRDRLKRPPSSQLDSCAAMLQEEDEKA